MVNRSYARYRQLQDLVISCHEHGARHWDEQSGDIVRLMITSSGVWRVNFVLTASCVDVMVRTDVNSHIYLFNATIYVLLQEEVRYHDCETTAIEPMSLDACALPQRQL